MKCFAKIAVLILLVMAAPVSAAPLGPGGADAILRSIGSCGDPCVVYGNRGGRIVDFEDAASAIRKGARHQLVIDGYCASACMVLADQARPRACITSRAVFAYHKTNRNRPIPLRADLHSWIMQHGGFPEFQGTPGVMPNQAALHFWPQCREPSSTTASMTSGPAG